MNNNVFIKILILVATIVLMPVITALYGVVLDEITYTISYEYYTKFKFIQFELWNYNTDAKFLYPRKYVAAVGILATWWVGLIIGTVLGCIACINKSYQVMFKKTYESVLIIFVVILIFGLVGLLVGCFANPYVKYNYTFTSQIIHEREFFIVGKINLYTYKGFVFGLFVGVYHQLRTFFSKQIK
jgi:hypothetical protein